MEKDLLKKRIKKIRRPIYTTTHLLILLLIQIKIFTFTLTLLLLVKILETKMAHYVVYHTEWRVLNNGRSLSVTVVTFFL